MPSGYGQITIVGNRVRLTAEIEGGEQIDLILSRFGAEITDWRPFWREFFAPRFLADVQQAFETEGAPVGGWAELSPRYKAWKERYFPGRKILERSTRLKNSLTWTGEIGPEGVYRDSETQLEIGTSVPHGRYHHYGSPDTNLPQRRFLWLGATTDYGRLLHRWLVLRAGASGLPLSPDAAREGGEA